MPRMAEKKVGLNRERGPAPVAGIGPRRCMYYREKELVFLLVTVHGDLANLFVLLCLLVGGGWHESF